MKKLATLALTLSLATAPLAALANADNGKAKKKVNTSLRVIMEQQKAPKSKAITLSLEKRALLNRQLPYRTTQA